MSQIEKGMRCPHCDRHVLARRQSTNQVLHLLLTLLTCGLWLLVWMSMDTAGKLQPWLCTQCGRTLGRDIENAPIGRLMRSKASPRQYILYAALVLVLLYALGVPSLLSEVL